MCGLSFLGYSQDNQTVDEAPPLDVEFSIEGGMYQELVEVALSCIDCKLYYTLDGSTPSRKSKAYRSPITIKKSTVLRAVGYRGQEKSNIVGRTYFIDEPSTQLAVVSIGVKPSLLFDATNGLFMEGAHAVDSVWHKPGANYWSRREVTAHIDIFESNGNNVFSSRTGLRLFGGMSRIFPQKSLAIVARDRLGKKRIRHPLFGKEKPKKYKFLVLRNSGSDFGKSHFRDGLMTGLVDDWDLETQAFRPAHVYINGTYWGIYNIREKINKYFLAAHSDCDRDSVDLMEHRFTRKLGDKQTYLSLLNFLETHPLDNDSNYQQLQTMMDVDNFMHYQIAQIYFDNQDAGGNIRYWRPQTPEGRWRWILYDTDWGMGLHDAEAYKNNSLAFHTSPNGPNWPNPPWSTFILRKLLENPNFEAQFVQRFNDYLNSDFSTTNVHRHILQKYTAIAPEINRHIKRWRRSNKKWEKAVSTMKVFASERPTYIRSFLQDAFDTGQLRTIKAKSSKGGHVEINEVIVVRNVLFEGEFFENYPVEVKAVPEYGYRFSHWQNVSDEYKNQRKLTIAKGTETVQLVAIFEKYTHPLVGKLMINEVCPYDKKSGDWIEIYNNTEQTVDMTNWILTDTKNEYIFPPSTIEPNNYLVVCKDSTRFVKTHRQAYNVVGRLPFGLDKKGEKLQLFSNDLAVVDSINFQLPPMDTSVVVSLLLPSLDNADVQNWQIKLGHGTPNAPNPWYVESQIKYRQQQWVQLGMTLAVAMLCVLLLWLRYKEIL